jgi:hypothetical protein
MKAKQLGGIFEALSLFIVDCSFVIVEWRGSGNDKMNNQR